MGNLIIVGLVAVFLFVIIRSLFLNRPDPPQIVYVQIQPSEKLRGSNLPLIILMAVIILVILLGS